MDPTPEQIAAMESRGWKLRGGTFRTSAPSIGLVLSVWWDVSTGSGWHWSNNSRYIPNGGRPTPTETADDAEAWLRSALAEFRFPWLT